MRHLQVLMLLFGILLIAAYLTEARFFRLCAYLVLTGRGRRARSCSPRRSSPAVDLLVGFARLGGERWLGIACWLGLA